MSSLTFGNCGVRLWRCLSGQRKQKRCCEPRKQLRRHKGYDHIFLKELTDLGSLPPYEHPFGLCLVAAERGSTMPLKEVFDQPETMWRQFRRRLDRLYPFCRIAGHTGEEVREILAALENVYKEPFPQLNLRQWSGAIYT